MSRLGLRARLTAAFAVAMVLVLAGTGLFVYARLGADLDETVDEGLEARVGQVARQGVQTAPASDPEEGFTAVLAPDGRVVDASDGAPQRPLGASELRRAAVERIVFERRIPPLEGPVRVLAEPVAAGPGGAVVAVGQSLDDRDETLRDLAGAFAVGGVAAVAVAALLGYLLATAGLSPIARMRRRAGEISLARPGERLPLPEANDEVRRLAETLNEMLARLERSFERERRFVADASHELRTPVAVVKTELENALRGGGLSSAAREAIVAAVDECDHLAQLAEDLLVIARAGDGELPVRREALALRPALEGVRERFADRAHEHGRAIVVECPEELTVEADPLRLRQALGNLVDNALRHGAGEVTLRAAVAGSTVQIDVADEGPGFAAEVAGRAFERFTRGDAARTRGGAGLGLAIVRAVAEAHGGGTEVVPGAVTTVRLSLPALSGSSQRVVLPSAPSGQPTTTGDPR